MAQIRQIVHTMVAILCDSKYPHPTKLELGLKEMGISMDFIIKRKNKSPRDMKYNSILVHITKTLY
jgi:hypothetical protein